MAAEQRGVIRDLTPNDRAELARFHCRDFAETWSTAIEEMVQVHLADALGRDRAVCAAGLWADDVLVAVAAWRVDADPEPSARCLLLAVQMGHRRKGYGRRLKQEVLARSQRAGATTVSSLVHWDNDAMIELNFSLGASVRRTDDDPEHCLCVIPLNSNDDPRDTGAPG